MLRGLHFFQLIQQAHIHCKLWNHSTSTWVWTFCDVISVIVLKSASLCLLFNRWLCQSRIVFMWRFGWRKGEFYGVIWRCLALVKCGNIISGFRKCCDCREKPFIVWFTEGVNRQNAGMWWSSFYQKLCAKRASWTGGHFVCACVRPLSDNSVGESNLMAGNRKPGVKLQSFRKPFRWCFKFCTFLQKVFSMTKIGRFLRRFSVVDFLAAYRFCWLFKDFIDPTPKSTVFVYVWFSLVERCISKEEMHRSKGSVAALREAKKVVLREVYWLVRCLLLNWSRRHALIYGTKWNEIYGLSYSVWKLFMENI